MTETRLSSTAGFKFSWFKSIVNISLYQSWTGQQDKDPLPRQELER